MVDTKNTITAHKTKIPLDWKVKKLGDVGKIRMCKRIFNHETNEQGDIPFFKIGTFGKEPDAFIPKDLYDNYRKKFSFPKKGEILISAAGTLGRTVVYDGSPAYFQDSNIVWIDNSELIVTNQYLYYVYQIVKYESEGGTIQRLYNSIISNAEFICPPLSEQKAIAQVLSKADAAVHTTEKLIAQKELRKKWLMQQLLSGKKRLKGFYGEWKRMMLGDIGEIKTSSVDKVLLEEERIVNLVNYMDVYRNRFITPEFECKKTSANEREINTFSLRKGDILFTPSSETPDDIGHSAVVTADLENTVYSYHLVRFRLFEETTLAYNFRAYVFNNQNILNEFSRRATGSTRFTISKSDFEEIETKIPPTLEEQTAIAQLLQAADKEISLLKAKAEKLREQKKGLMQVLLTGKVRLKIK
jgi:type I restriction enzyme S subunit